LAEVRLTVEQAMQIFDAIAHSRRFFAKRDEMNAEVHLGAVRWSPLTVLVADAEDVFKDLLQEQAIIGAPLQHKEHSDG
jgi:hypothetical protein